VRGEYCLPVPHKLDDAICGEPAQMELVRLMAGPIWICAVSPAMAALSAPIPNPVDISGPRPEPAPTPTSPREASRSSCSASSLQLPASDALLSPIPSDRPNPQSCKPNGMKTFRRTFVQLQWNQSVIKNPTGGTVHALVRIRDTPSRNWSLTGSIHVPIDPQAAKKLRVAVAPRWKLSCDCRCQDPIT
jgi:hypothetical protein